MAKAWAGHTWRVTYTHDRIPAGMKHPGHVYEVKAWDEMTARMRAGIARACSAAGWYTNNLFKPQKVKWEIVSIERID